MKPCSCGFQGIGEVIGIAYGLFSVPHHIQHNCPSCGSTCGIKWQDAPEELRQEAVDIELKRMSITGAI